MAEPIEVPFGMWTWMGQTEICVRWGPAPPGEDAILGVIS